jgi:deoxyribonuclease IV
LITVNIELGVANREAFHPIGIHVSISGKLDLSVDRAIELGCSGTFQIFTCSPRRWDASPLDEIEVLTFRKKVSDSKFKVHAHMPYLPNLSSPDDNFYSKSVRVLVREIGRCGELGVENLVLHFGSHLNTSIDAGAERIIAACKKAIDETKGTDVRLLLENSADPKSVGSNFETIGNVLKRMHNNKRMGVCLDTCHALASGYDFSNSTGVEKSLELFDSSIGLSNLFLIHLNDSKGKIGSGLDRHENIGKGNMGAIGMTAFLRSDKLDRLPVVLETAGDIEGGNRENIETTKRLMGG